ncbi:hypothetical protein C9422_01440 [Pseudomonas sp. B1(2018)]|nr:hypothetical protein C9422_01440 [Pseudomonas sp. B1(2018)]
MVVNDIACDLDERSALEFIASNRASTGCSYGFPGRRRCAVKSAPYPPRQPAGWSTGVRSA